MWGRSMKFEKIGIKVSNPRFFFSSKDALPKIAEVFDYFEFAAPSFALPKVVELAQKMGLELRCHGTMLSLAARHLGSEQLVHSSLDDLKTSKSPYFVEHVGLLNRQEFGPSLGYLLEPMLNQITLECLRNNISRLNSFLGGMPLLLENSVHYGTHQSQLSIPQFIEIFCGFEEHFSLLVDMAHLEVTCANNGVEIGSLLEAYARQREIVEVHFSGIREGRDGVFHDNHDPLSEGFLRSIRAQRDALEPFLQTCQNGTIEASVSSMDAVNAACRAGEILRNKNSGKISGQEKKRHSAPYEVRQEAELKGRTRILTERIRAQLGVSFEHLLETILQNFGYSSLHDFSHHVLKEKVLLNRCFVGTFGTEPDSFDLLCPIVFALVEQGGLRSIGVEDTLKKLVLRSFSNAIKLKRCGYPGVLVEFNQPIRALGAKKILIDRNKNNMLVARGFSGGLPDGYLRMGVPL
jgi:hypothetical protein